MTTSRAYGINRDEGELSLFLGTVMRLKAGTEQTNGGFGLIEQTLPPGFAPPLHIHHGEDEAFYLLEGEASFTSGEVTIRATAGSFIFFPRNIPHYFRIEGDGPARLLQLNAPGGLERFFFEAGDEGGEPDFRRLAEIAARYNIEILGPPPE